MQTLLPLYLVDHLLKPRWATVSGVAGSMGRPCRERLPHATLANLVGENTDAALVCA
ncbi:hypothetical protein [Sandarakinorhabdus limnophila]|uniref:hypothetical protein n=1 Tax=Sandarakinorhabdus limnophila TaxID=210512 RepID=UPI0026F1920A|nr:hypothetical protein [Sandarakinorhabdus limnophila]